jgi:hypothetical protein
MLDTSQDAHMVACVDDDQRDLYMDMPTHPRLTVRFAPRTDVVGAINGAVKAMPDYEVYGLIVDDSYFKTPGWDKWLETEINSWPNRIGVVSANHQWAAHVNFGYVTREWIDTVGWYACPTTQHFCWDSVLEMLGEATRITYATKDQFHIHHDLIQKDATVQIFALDAIQFLGWCVNERRDLVAKIREAMCASVS